MTDQEIFDSSRILVNEHRQLVTENCGGFPALRILVVDADGKSRVPTYGTPVNAVAASKVLTVADTPHEGDTVPIGGKTYKFRAAIGAGSKAAKILTLSDVAVNGDTLTIDDQVYTFKDALSADPVVPNEILVELTAEGAIDNLIAAIGGGAGSGTKYSAGTLAPTSVNVTKGSASTVNAEAKEIGFTGNDIDIAETMTNGSWAGDAVNLSGGVDAQAANDVLIGANAEAAIDNLVLAITKGTGEGTKYGTGTTANALVTAAKTTASTMTATNKIKGVIGNDTPIDADGEHLSWAGDATELSGGINGTIGYFGQKMADASYEYECFAPNTINDANWKREEHTETAY